MLPKAHTLTPATRIAELLDAMSCIPKLPAAACRNHTEVFDDAAAGDGRRPTQVASARQAALQICRSCRELQRCRDWVDSLPASQRPLGGVIAGRIITAKSQWLQSKPSF